MSIKSTSIILCTGTRPSIPPIESLEETGYLTSDTLLKLTRLPKSIAIIVLVLLILIQFGVIIYLRKKPAPDDKERKGS